MLIASDADEPVSVTLAAGSSPVPFIRENGEDAYFQLLQKNYERWAVQYQCEEYSIGRVERSVDGRTLPGIRFDYVSGGVSSGDEILIWLEDDHMGIINISNFMFDNVQDTLDLIRWMEGTEGRSFSFHPEERRDGLFRSTPEIQKALLLESLSELSWRSNYP